MIAICRFQCDQSGRIGQFLRKIAQMIWAQFFKRFAQFRQKGSRFWLLFAFFNSQILTSNFFRQKLSNTYLVTLHVGRFLVKFGHFFYKTLVTLSASSETLSGKKNEKCKL
jgi:hypothetical protein